MKKNLAIKPKNTGQTSFQEYVDIFVQRVPRFILKTGPGKSWRTINKGLGDRLIQAHLEGTRSIGALGRWYPGHCYIDIDKSCIEYVEVIREKLSLKEGDSMLCSSESENSYHLLLKPIYNQKPPSLKLLNNIFKPFCESNNVEIYPAPKKCSRLPFGKIQRCLDPGSEWLETWEQKTYWFEKLNDFNITKARIPGDQIDLPFERPINQENIRLSTFEKGKELFEFGLQALSTRHESQWEVLYYLWRKNVPCETAIQTVYTWIKKKHNGFSVDIKTDPRRVKKEIERQAYRIYENYLPVYPDSTHNSYNGWLTKADLVDIFKITKGSLSLSRFLFHIIKYYYPRRFRERVNIHSNLLISWSSRDTYLKYISMLEKKNLLYRGEHYITTEEALKNNTIPMSKELKLKWDYRALDDAILIEDRSPSTLESSIQAAFTFQEARALLQASGVERHLLRHTKALYEKL